MYNCIKTIRYMGNKNRLLDFIVPEILKISKEGDVVCELMCGTCCVGYAIKDCRTIYENDIQYYSYVIAKGLIENNDTTISSTTAFNDLYSFFELNLKEKRFCFFEKEYSDTYFSEKQCLEIDSIRYAISQVQENKQYLYLVSLMNAMCVCQSTSGHFAQYLPSDHPRLESIRSRSIWNEFLEKCNDFNQLFFSKYSNQCFNVDYKVLINSKSFNAVDVVYVDPPYTGEQYSRFYHVLETVCKYDNPQLEYKGLYRKDRFTSDLSLRKKAFNEFDNLLKVLSDKKKKVVLSYSTKGLLKEYEMEFLFKKYFKTYYVKRMPYNHSTQGKGSVELEELLFIGY